MPRKSIPHVKRVTAKGKVYHYFDTGQREAGRVIYTRLPDPADKLRFGGAYAAALAARTKRLEAREVLTVPTLVDQYLKSPVYAKKAAGTRKVYRIYLTKFADMLPTAPAGEVKPEHIVRLMDKMAHQPGAANMLLGSVSGLYKWARQRRIVSNEPSRGVEPHEMGEHEPWPENLLAEALEADEVRLPVHLLYYTAQRIGDVCRMRWSDIIDGAIHVVQQKTGTALRIPIHAALAEELERAERKGETILAGLNGRARKIDTIRQHIQAWAKARGHKVVPHGLRKNAINALLEAGCSAAEAAAISGQSLQMVEHYAKMRSQSTLAGSAITKWNASGTGKRVGKPLATSRESE